LLRGLKEYKGVFEERNISNQFKEKIWKLLLQGEIGVNKTKLIFSLRNYFEKATDPQKKELIAAFANLYSQVDDESQKEKITAILYNIAENNDEIGQVALDAYIAIKG
jgi:hypothetical protein